MKTKLLDSRDGERVFMLVFGRGETMMDALLAFLRENSVSAARLTAIRA